jgi:hypothetical protein
MKKTLYFFAAMTLAASSAMASKARVSALSSSPAVTDIQSIFTNPADVHYVGDFVTFEMGETAANALNATDTKIDTNADGIPDSPATVVPNAEGGFITTMGDAKFGAYLGGMPSDANLFRAYGAAVATFLPTENPIEVFYGAKAGDLNWGASFGFSNSARKNGAGATDDQSQNAMGVRMGVKTDEWAAYANVGLGSVAKTGDAQVKGTAGLVLGGHYMMDNMKIYGRYLNAGAKVADASGTDQLDITSGTTTVGFTNSWKNDGNLAFYGLAYQMANTTEKVADAKTVTTAMPFTMGAEVLATSWLKLRGSISQNVLMGNSKTTTAGVGETDSISHNTVTAAGAGFIWGRNNLDVVMKMGTNGNLDSSAGNFGSQASYTYTF